KRERHTARSSATFSKRSNQVRNSKNDGVLIYANILDAMEKAEEAIQGMDIARFREARSLFDRFYDTAHQYAIKSRDQQLLNQTFLLRHFMAELATTGDRAMIHGHEEARAQLKKDADYRRYFAGASPTRQCAAGRCAALSWPTSD
ncbi:MAG: hypothetical protein GXP29_09860, partial [Planctomycetes bacterium]|nr:hypothetical protein [Planctomycetota bacterium]